ncbi:MAG TPA: hypothetical protein VFX70_02855 [Mycobacteriales bacterium]|nr:hypothetical protein [Mycobacteriales bacterium]
MSGTNIALLVTLLVVVGLTAALAVTGGRFHSRIHSRVPEPEPNRPRRRRPPGWTRAVLLSAVLAAGLISGLVMRLIPPSGDTVSLRVWLDSDAAELRLPGQHGNPCDSHRIGSRCVVAFQEPTGAEVTVQAVPRGGLPGGAEVVYYGCEEGDGAPSCTVRTDVARVVCASTTSPADQSLRTMCGQVSGVVRDGTPGGG